MVFISVVPDDFYFVWQIELQLFNFKNLGLPKEQIHILIGADAKYGLSIWFKEFIEQNSDKASFFVYQRIVEKFNYLPSVRPHLLKQHFKEHPCLELETIFYHDSDIIFRELPGFDKLAAGEEWYVADTRSYLDSGYIKSAGSDFLPGMCSVIGIDISVVEANDQNAGGAQYVLKGITADFWEKVENDCENLYLYLEDRNKTINKVDSSYSGIQSWCTDMWVIFWNGLKLNKKIRISEELNFSWAGDPIDNYAKYKIYHNTGISAAIDRKQHKVFNKTDFNNHAPYYFQHEAYSKDYCAYEFVKLIREYESSVSKEDMSDVTFLMPVHVDSKDRLVNLEITTRYIHRHFTTTIILLEAGPEPKVDPAVLPPNAQYHFIEDHSNYFYHTKYNNILLRLSTTRYIALYDVDVVFSPSQIRESVYALRDGKAYISYPYSGLFRSTERWIKDLFRRTINYSILDKFKEYCPFTSKRSYGGCVFLERETFLANGGDNENFTSWGPEDIERPARYKILGFSIHRSQGELFHLDHERGTNSGYQEETYYDLISEYLKICSYSREELQEYIGTWNFCLP